MELSVRINVQRRLVFAGFDASVFRAALPPVLFCVVGLVRTMTPDATAAAEPNTLASTLIAISDHRKLQVERGAS